MSDAWTSVARQLSDVELLKSIEKWAAYDPSKSMNYLVVGYKERGPSKEVALGILRAEALKRMSPQSDKEGKLP